MKIRIQNTPFDLEQIQEKKSLLASWKLSNEQLDNYVFTGGISNQAYVPDTKTIKILTKSGEVSSLQEHSELFVGNSFSNVESNEIIAALSKKFSGQPFWAAKSLLLMAKNFYELGDAFQATFILESMISNYTQFQDLNDEGNQLLNKIKQVTVGKLLSSIL